MENVLPPASPEVPSPIDDAAPGLSAWDRRGLAGLIVAHSIVIVGFLIWAIVPPVAVGAQYAFLLPSILSIVLCACARSKAASFSRGFLLNGWLGAGGLFFMALIGGSIWAGPQLPSLIPFIVVVLLIQFPSFTDTAGRQD